jgi:hypothetical protein
MSQALTVLVLVSLVATADKSAAPHRISPADAKNHVGEVATVCGRVADASISKYGVGSMGWPISLDVDGSESNPAFIITTLSPKHLKLEDVQATYQKKTACATGKITLLRGVPAIMTSKLSDVAVQPEADK